MSPTLFAKMSHRDMLNESIRVTMKALLSLCVVKLYSNRQGQSNAPFSLRNSKARQRYRRVPDFQWRSSAREGWGGDPPSFLHLEDTGGQFLYVPASAENTANPDGYVFTRGGRWASLLCMVGRKKITRETYCKVYPISPRGGHVVTRLWDFWFPFKT